MSSNLLIMNNYFKRLRKQLPYRYTRAISDQLEDVTQRQVKAVFEGRITNQILVHKVVDAAIKVRKITNSSNKRLLQKLQMHNRSKTTKRAA